MHAFTRNDEDAGIGGRNRTATDRESERIFRATARVTSKRSFAPTFDAVLLVALLLHLNIARTQQPNPSAVESPHE